VHGPAEVQTDAAGGERVGDVAGVTDGTSQPVELGDHEGVAGSAGGEGLALAGVLAVDAGDAMVDVDPVGLHAEGCQGLALGSEILPVGRDPGVADLDRGHGRSIAEDRRAAAVAAASVAAVFAPQRAPGTRSGRRAGTAMTTSACSRGARR
jgi:hypothetical protein